MIRRRGDWDAPLGMEMQGPQTQKNTMKETSGKQFLRGYPPLPSKGDVNKTKTRIYHSPGMMGDPTTTSSGNWGAKGRMPDLHHTKDAMTTWEQQGSGNKGSRTVGHRVSGRNGMGTPQV